MGLVRLVLRLGVGWKGRASNQALRASMRIFHQYSVCIIALSCNLAIDDVVYYII